MKYSPVAVQAALNFAEGIGGGDAVKPFAPLLEDNMAYAACDILATEIRRLQREMDMNRGSRSWIDDK